MSDTTQNPAASQTPATPGQGQPAPTQAPNQGTAAQNALKVLMERDAALRDRESKLKAREAQLGDVESLNKSFASPADLVRAMAARGITLEAVQKYVQESTPGSIAPVTEKLSAMESELATLRQEREETRRRAAMEEEQARITKALSPTDFPLISRAGAHKVVLDHMIAHYNATGDWVSESEAAKAVEAQLRTLATQLGVTQGAPNTAPPPATHSWEPTITNGLSGEAHRQFDSNPDPIKWDQEARAMLRRAQNHG